MWRCSWSLRVWGRKGAQAGKGCFYSVQLVRLSESDEWAILGRKKLSFQGVVGRIHTEENRSEARNTLWQGEDCSRRGNWVLRWRGPTAAGRKLSSKLQTWASRKGMLYPRCETRSASVGWRWTHSWGLLARGAQKSPTYLRPVLIIQSCEMTVLKHIQMVRPCIQRRTAVSFFGAFKSSVCYLLHSTE